MSKTVKAIPGGYAARTPFLILECVPVRSNSIKADLTRSPGFAVRTPTPSAATSST